MDIELVQIFDCDVETFERIMDDPEVIEEQVRRIPSLKERKVVSFEEDERYRRRRVSFILNYDQVPKAARRVIKPEHLVFQEVSAYDKEKKAFEFEGVPPLLKDKLEVSGSYSLHAIEGGKTRREVKAHARLKVFAVGRLVERFLRKHLEMNYAMEVEVINEHIRKPGEANHIQADPI